MGPLATTNIRTLAAANIANQLCINAGDAMPDGGTIIIETGDKWLDHRAARGHNLDAGQDVTVSVSDAGTGIDKTTLLSVFLGC